MAEEQKEKALLDTEELAGFDEPMPSDSDKVELDLDDAPFLDDDDEEEEPPAEEPTQEVATTEEGEEDGEKKPSPIKALVEKLKAFLKTKKGKFALIGLGAAILLLLAAIIFMPAGEKPAPPPPPVVEEEPVVEIEPDEVVPFEFIVSLEPFMVEYEQPDGSYRFLTTRISLATENEKLSFEIRNKMVVLRDAIFYYLRNKDMVFLADKNNVNELKRDLLSVVNQFLANDQLEVILIEEYLIK